MEKKKTAQEKVYSILFWISFRFFFLLRSNLMTGTGIDQGELSVSRETFGNALNTNLNCLKVRLKTNSKGWGDMKLSLKVGNKFRVNYTIIGKVFWYKMEFSYIIHCQSQRSER